MAKVHAEAARFAARGDTVVFIGHAGHEETEGTLGVAPRSTLLVQTPADVAALNLPEGTQLSYLTQTTLALDETADVIDALRARFPTLGQPPLKTSAMPPRTDSVRCNRWSVNVTLCW